MALLTLAVINSSIQQSVSIQLDERDTGLLVDSTEKVPAVTWMCKIKDQFSIVLGANIDDHLPCLLTGLRPSVHRAGISGEYLLQLFNSM